TFLSEERRAHQGLRLQFDIEYGKSCAAARWRSPAAGREDEVEELAPVHHADGRAVPAGLKHGEAGRIAGFAQLAEDAELVVRLVDAVGAAMREINRQLVLHRRRRCQSGIRR